MAYLQILRPANLIFVLICVGFGAYYPEFLFRENLGNVIAGMLSAALIAGAGYVINDYYDYDIDLVNRPDRVLPSKKIPVTRAFLYSLILFLSGIFASYFTGSIICLLLACANSILLFLYGLALKRVFFWGNILVAYAAASAFIFGSIITQNLSNSFIIAVYAFLYTLLREIIKDLEDRQGDKAAGAKTLALVWTKKQVIILYFCITALIMLLTVYYYIKMYFIKNVFILMMVFVVLPLLLFYRYIENRDSKKDYKFVSQLMKLDMFILLIILGTGNLIW